ncbi:MAG TPA: His/Gly/Thr/Pro-type tRNA ligase C-terminal domain-containing protein, partial [Burkholderiales bacterium]|nr:His/Gly/Thr/Pro-type tRNA ligase C-terminal domain-containing protein [Burkholderiales bacterium]
LHCGGGSFKAQMKKADASGARFACIIGDEEAQTEKMTLKPLRIASEQTQCTRVQGIELLKSRN